MSFLKAADIRLSVAPMMERTDRHCRYLHRLLSKRVRLYTEMVVAQALHYASDPTRWLAHDRSEHPVAFQLGGSDPKMLAGAARKIADAGFDEINLNAGCPSDRVSSGRFGACLMAEPGVIGDCISAMKNVVNIPITLKTRIGIDQDEGDDRLNQVADAAIAAGCDAIIVHARNAVLQGLSPKENREIPPLRYDRVYRLKVSRPHVPVILNGGVTTLTDTAKHLEKVDGVMIGRAAYERPFDVLGPADQHIFGGQGIASEIEIARSFLNYAEREIAAGERPLAVLKHAVNLFRNRPGARQWRQIVSTANSDRNAAARLGRLLDEDLGAEVLAA